MKLMKLILILSIFSVSACMDASGSMSNSRTNTSKSSQLASEELALLSEAKSLVKQSNDIITRNTIDGALVGAAIGCGLSLALGGNADDCVSGGLLGGVTGAAVGNNAGTKAAKANETLVKQKQIINKLGIVNVKLDSIEKKLLSVLKKQNEEILSLETQLRAGQISDGELKSRVRGINASRKALRSSLQQASSKIDKAYDRSVKLENSGDGDFSASKIAARSTKKRLTSAIKKISILSL